MLAWRLSKSHQATVLANPVDAVRHCGLKVSVLWPTQECRLVLEHASEELRPYVRWVERPIPVDGCTAGSVRYQGRGEWVAARDWRVGGEYGQGMGRGLAMHLPRAIYVEGGHLQLAWACEPCAACVVQPPHINFIVGQQNPFIWEQHVSVGVLHLPERKTVMHVACTHNVGQLKSWSPWECVKGGG
jgi:hypothetical protein